MGMKPLKRIVKWLGLTKVGGYEFHELIASGPMSDIHRAVNPKAPGRVFAVKVLKDDGLKMRQVIRKRQPNLDRVILAVDHPNVVKTYEFGVLGNRHYQVMDYIQGVDLGAFQAKSARFTLEMLVGAAKALEHLSSKYKLIFRDMNPNNIVIGPDNIPRLIDLDMAVQDTGDSSGFLRRTGTPGYMAPEQVKGGQLSTRTDIYAWGATAYEALTEFNPFRDGTGKNARERMKRTHAKHLKVLPPAPTVINKKLPSSLDDIILKCLSLMPEDRYGSFTELISDLAEVRL